MKQWTQRTWGFAVRVQNKTELRQRVSAVLHRSLWEAAPGHFPAVYLCVVLADMGFLFVSQTFSFLTHSSVVKLLCSQAVFVMPCFYLITVGRVFFFFPGKIYLVSNKLTSRLFKILVFLPTILLYLLVSCDSVFAGDMPPTCLLLSHSSVSLISFASLPIWTEQQTCDVWNENKKLSLCSIADAASS